MTYKGYEVENLFGKINKENIFIGNLKKCIKFEEKNLLKMESLGGIDCFGFIEEESEIYKEDVVIIRLCNNPNVYVTLSELKNVISFFDVYDSINKDGISIGKNVLSTMSSYAGEIFVDKNSLKPYYEKEKGKVKVRKIKRDSLTDVRIKGGIEH